MLLVANTEGGIPFASKKANIIMLYSSSVILKLYRPVPLWQYAAVFLVVGLVHGLLLAVVSLQEVPPEKTLLTQRLLVRTIQLPAPVVSPVVRPSEPTPPVTEPAVREPARQAPVPKPVSKPVPDPASKKAVPVQRAREPAKKIPEKPQIDTVPPPTVAVKTPPLMPAPTPSAMSAAPVVEQVAARYDAAYLHNPAPAYPIMSRRRREQGTVQLQVWVSAEGRAIKVALLHSSGFERLDAAAVDTVRQWRFVPARRGEVAMASSVVVPIVFALN